MASNLCTGWDILQRCWWHPLSAARHGVSRRRTSTWCAWLEYAGMDGSNGWQAGSYCRRPTTNESCLPLGVERGHVKLAHRNLVSPRILKSSLKGHFCFCLQRHRSNDPANRLRVAKTGQDNANRNISKPPMRGRPDHDPRMTRDRFERRGSP